MSRYAPPSAAQVEQMNACAAMLGNALTGLDSKVTSQDMGFTGWVNSGLNDLVGSGFSAEQTRSALGQWHGQLDALRSFKRDDVISGDYSLDGWFGEAHAVYDAVASTTTDIGAWTWDGIVSQTYDATKKEVVEDAKIAGILSLPVLLAAGAVYFLLIFGRRG